MRSVDINCDMGEAFGRWQIGDTDDAALMPLISSANIAYADRDYDDYDDTGPMRFVEATMEEALAARRARGASLDALRAALA